jgi:hypothetical protein
VKKKKKKNNLGWKKNSMQMKKAGLMYIIIFIRLCRLDCIQHYLIKEDTVLLNL